MLAKQCVAAWLSQQAIGHSVLAATKIAQQGKGQEDRMLCACGCVACAGAGNVGHDDALLSCLRVAVNCIS